MTSYNIIDVVNGMDDFSRAFSFNTLHNSTLARAIMAAKGCVWLRKRYEFSPENVHNMIVTVREYDDPAMFMADFINGADNEDRFGDSQLRAVTGAEELPSALIRLDRMFVLWRFIAHEIETEKLYRVRDAGRIQTMDGMLDYFSKPDDLDPQKLAHVAMMTGLPEDYLLQQYNAEQARNATSFTASREEIESILQSMPDAGYHDCVDALDPVSHHQLGIKLLDKYAIEYHRISRDLFRPKGAARMGDQIFLMHAWNKVENWVIDWEKKYGSEFDEAEQSGRNIEFCPRWPFPLNREKALAA